MKRRQFIKAAGVGLAATAIAAPAIAQSMPEVKWRLTASWPKSLDTLFGAARCCRKPSPKPPTTNSRSRPSPPAKSCRRLQALDAASNAPSKCAHTASYYYFGKDPTFAFGTSVAFGPNQRLNQGWFMQGGGGDVLNEFYKKYNVMMLLGGNTGCQMGGWFRKEIKTVDDLKGLKFRIGGFPGRVIAEARRRAAAARRAATSIRRWRRASSTPPSGSAPMTTRSSASTRSRNTTTRPVGGRAARCSAPSSTSTSGTRCRRTTRPSCATLRPTPTTGCVAKYDLVNPPALKRLIANGAQLRAFSPEIMEAC